MADEPQPINIVNFAVEIMEEFIAELRERFPGIAELSEKDRAAIHTAIAKAAWRGVLRGAATAQYAFNEQLKAESDDPEDSDLVLDLHLDIEGSPGAVDHWAQKYGDDA